MAGKRQKMAFYEIGKGRYAQWMQEEFERAQSVCEKTGSAVKITSTIEVLPSDTNEAAFGSIAFNVKVSLPARKSMKYTTEIENGFIVSDGESTIDVLQEKLDLGFPSVVKFNRDTGEVVSNG